MKYVVQQSRTTYFILLKEMFEIVAKPRFQTLGKLNFSK